MSKDSDFDSLPSYQEALPSGPSLLLQLSGARSQHIKYVVSSQILPILSKRASKGLSKTTVALIPQYILPTSSMLSKSIMPDILSSRSIDEQAFQLIGLADTDEPFEEVQLEGNINTHEFWEQDEVLSTLQNILSNELAISSEFSSPKLLERIATSDSLQESSTLPPRPDKATRSFSLFGKRSTPTPQKTPSVKKPTPQIQVSVGLEEVCYRTSSHFGLYETISRRAVIVRVTTR
jgi:hypothetical protein